MTITSRDSETLVAAFRSARDGDTITIPAGVYELTPDVPIDICNKPTGGAPLVLDGKRGVKVLGQPGAKLVTTRHGCAVAMNNCQDIEISGLEIAGNGYYLGQEDWYWALLFLNGVNNRLKIHHNHLHDSGDHLIAHLLDGHTDDSELAFNQLERCGYLDHPKIGGDGTGIAVCGSRNWVHHNRATCCFRDYEQETKYEHPTEDNVWEDNVSEGTLFNPFLFQPGHSKAELFRRTIIRRNSVFVWQPEPKIPQWSKVHPFTFSGGTGYLVENNLVSGQSTDWVAMDFSPDKSDLLDCVVRGNIIFGGGSTGISIGPSQGPTPFRVARMAVLDNKIGPMGGYPIWYEATEGVWVSGNKIVRAQYAPVMSKCDPRLTCCGRNTVL